MGVAHHAGYFAWFEVGRTDLLREHGMTYRELEAEGVRLPVTSAQARYRKPVHYDDVLEVRTRLTAMGAVRVAFEYEVHRAGTDGPLAIGTTEHAAIDARGRPRRLPDKLRELARVPQPSEDAQS